MIPLNRPYHISGTAISTKVENEWAAHGYKAELLYASREGLYCVYQKLYKERGTLRVAVSPLTCFIAIYSIIQAGHIPIFIDINAKTLNMDEQKLVLHENIDVVQVIHLGGNPMQMDVIMQWAEMHNVVVIEDCAQALLSRYRGQMVGTFGDYAVYSMVKNLYAEAGGLLLYNENANLKLETQEVSLLVMTYKRIKQWLEHRVTICTIWNGLYKSLLYLKESKEGEFFGNNTIHCLPTSSVERVKTLLGAAERIQEERMRKVYMLIGLIDRSKYDIQEVVEGAESNRNRVLLVARNKQALHIIQTLRKQGIAANNLTQSYLHGYQEHIAKDSHLAKYYTEILPVYEELMPRVISVPCSPDLKQEEIVYIAKRLNEIG